ncbi:NAD(P)-dependent oxidoreductase [Oscillatoria sp. FACHB-1407]|uniref:NAD-dependent epimerase/dehydratase family protein n=1 Tax=Oscillatoria sp. FACHB-1407 TaxID=2692847 RepID=UPI0016870774|nr:NAD(P)-dependent oxidoreductase [Oscillatoria sp. FACHB-1407]MBD2459682.1 NAD(P)-dependent oxidoreductase [Oscillatoria sp. FACHB-1407]
MLTVGVIGASGFIGQRIAEVLHTQEKANVRAIVRSQASSSQLRLSGVDHRIANALDQSALEKAFKGCDVIIHSATGSPGFIRGTMDATYKAAQRANVRRLIYMSSMCVHGQAPAPGTREESPLRKPQPFPYNSAKIDSERSLLKLRSRGSVEVVIFRPGIVFGPRSPRIIEIANQILNGTAYLVNGGQGICNTTYIDNLVHAVVLAMYADGIDGQAFFIGEHEQVTWAELYHLLARALGVKPDQIPVVAPVGPQKTSLKQTIADSVLVQKLLASISDDLKQSVKKLLGKQKTASAPVSQPPLIGVQGSKQVERCVTYEMTLLHQSPYKLPYNKAEQRLGYTPIVRFPNAFQQTVEWLAANRA